MGRPAFWRGDVVRSRGLITALAAGLLGVAVWSVFLVRQLAEAGGELVDTTAYVAQLSSELVSARTDSDLLVDMLAVLRAEHVRHVELRGDGGARGRAFVSSRGLALLVDGLPDPGAGRAYQAWVEGGDGPRLNAGTFDVNAFGMASIVRTLPVLTGPVAVIVTLESSGGAPRPTSRPVLAGP